jgi:hypothetical protein
LERIPETPANRERIMARSSTGERGEPSWQG